MKDFPVKNAPLNLGHFQSHRDIAMQPDGLKTAVSGSLMATDIAGDDTTTATILIGETVIGDGETIGDSDWYQVTLVAGVTYQINMTGIDGFDPRLRLRASDGTILEDHDDFDYPSDVNAGFSFTATQSGSYYLDAMGPYNTGKFELTIVEIVVADDDYANDATTTGVVAVGGTVTGTSEAVSDDDWFAVTLVAGNNYQFSLQGVDGYDPFLSLHDENGTELAINDDIQYPSNVNSKLNYYIETTGIYYLSAEARYNTGDYDLSVALLAPDIADNVTTDAVLDTTELTIGAFEFQGDADWYKVTLEAGESYSFYTGYLDNNGTDLELYDSSGVLIDIANKHMFFTADVSGDYFLSTINTQPFAAEYEIQAYKDDHPDDETLITQSTQVGGIVSAELGANYDSDFFRFALEEGKYYTFEILTNDVSDMKLTYSGYGGDNFPTGFSIDTVVTFKALSDSGILRVLDYDYGQGSYSFSIQEIAITDDYGSDYTEAETGNLGSTYEGTIEASYDSDMFGFQFEAGVAYSIDLSSRGLDPLNSFFVRILDADGNAVGADVLHPNNDEGISYFATETSGTYYVDVQAYNILDTGDYNLRVSDDPVDVSPVSGITDESIFDGSVISYYFAEEGYQYPANWLFSSTDHTGEAWQQQSMDAMRTALDIYESVTQLTFVEVTSADAADFVFVDDWDTNIGGFFGFPGLGSAGLGVFDLEPPENQADFPLWSESLTPGGIYFSILNHELGHGLGLKHPHATGTQGEDRMLNVYGSGTPGLLSFNQQIFTVMSYNDGWAFGSENGQTAAEPSYGNQMGLGALDIAALGGKYGFNTDFATGDDVYEMSEENVTGVGYKTIWDNGGIDEIRYSGAADTVINLNDATLQYEIGGAGFVSYAVGVDAGYTIANSIEIENATGGSGNDVLIGNELDNTLTGNAGDDLLNGGAGRDILDGGAGNDTASYINAENGVRVNLAKSGFQKTHNDNYSKLVDIENLFGSAFDDRLTGDGADNRLTGADGDDRLRGKNGDDILNGNDGNDRLHGDRGDDTLMGGAGDDRLYGGSGDDALAGDAGDDRLRGNRGDDNLSGGAGDDNLKGGSGNDVLAGGAGSDVLRGGSGIDSFVFNTGDGHDTIRDFVMGCGETLVLDIAGISNLQDVMSIASRVGSSTVFDFGNGDELVVAHSRLDQFETHHFEFI